MRRNVNPNALVWSGGKICAVVDECTDPSKKTAYTNTKDLAYPPKPRPTKITLDLLIRPRFVRFCGTQ